MLAGALALTRPASLERRLGHGYLQGEVGDLWQRLLPVLPQVAHREAPGGGLAERDWRGNMAADAAARATAQGLRVEVDLRLRQHAALRALHSVRDAMGAVEVAALAAARGGPTRVQRRRYLCDGHFVRLLGRGAVSLGRGPPHLAVHELWPHAWPWQEGSEPGWAFAFVRCGASRARRTVVRCLARQLLGPCSIPGATSRGQRRAALHAGPVGSVALSRWCGLVGAGTLARNRLFAPCWRACCVVWRGGLATGVARAPRLSPRGGLGG